MSSKLAVLIDAENISYRDLPLILEEVPRYGQLVLRAIYGDWQRPEMQKWHQIATENNFKIRHQTNSARTKNSSDMKLIMDAMEVLHYTPIEIFCLVSNDADYVPLCHKIQESRKQVIGLGYRNASEAFIRACDRFIFIGRGEVQLTPLAVQPSVIPPKQPSSPAQPVAAAQKLILKAFACTPKDADGWAILSALGTALREIQASFQSNTYGHATLTKLLQSMPDVVELQTIDNVTSARLRDNIKQPDSETLKKLLSEAFVNASPDKMAWVPLTTLGSALRKVKPDFKTNAYGHATLSKLLKSLPDFIELNGNAARLKK